MVAPRTYPDELRERAVRMVLDAKQDPMTRTGACGLIPPVEYENLQRLIDRAGQPLPQVFTASTEPGT